jgi:hypothetical protein
MLVRQRAGILEVLTPIIRVFKAAMDGYQAPLLAQISLTRSGAFCLTSFPLFQGWWRVGIEFMACPPG